MGSIRAGRALALAIAVAFVSPVATLGAQAKRDDIGRAIADLEADHDRAIAAARLLQTGGADAASAIRDAWPSLSPVAQKRVLGTVAGLAGVHDAAFETLVQAARSEDVQLRKLALSALRRMAARGREGLATLLADPSVADSAALMLAQTEPQFAIAPLLAAIAGPGGADRPAFRSALARAVQRSDEGADRQIQRWLKSDPSAAAAASAALGLGSLGTRGTMVASLIEHALVDAGEFATAWRLLQSAGAAGPSAQIDAWLRSQLSAPEPWMLRQSAVDALAARGRREDARGALDDPYPRVRTSAALALSGDSESTLARATLARRDTWPMVRAAAVTGLRDEANALPVIVAAVDDSMSMVRAAAIEALRTASHDQGWERIHVRLRATNEWPVVTDAAIDYAAAHCRADSVDALARVILRARSSQALTEDLNSAARAIEALRIIGTEDARNAVDQLRRTEWVPPTLKIALERPLPGGARCRSAAP